MMIKKITNLTIKTVVIMIIIFVVAFKLLIRGPLWLLAHLYDLGLRLIIYLKSNIRKKQKIRCTVKNDGL